MQQEVHVEAALQGLIRLAPLGHHGRSGELGVQEGADLLPQADGATAVGVVLDQRARHVHPEAIAAHGEPEAHDVLEFLQRGAGAGGIHGLLPGQRGIQEAVVQRGLVGEKVDGAGAVTLGDAADTTNALRLLPDGIRPHIAVGVLIALRLHGFLEPGVLHGGVTGNEIQQHVHVPPVGFIEEAAEILIGTVTGRDGVEVCHVIARITEGRLEAGVDPQRIAAKIADVIQLFDDALEVADAVGVGVVEGLGVDLVEDRVVEPLGLLCCHGHAPLHFHLQACATCFCIV